MLRHMQASKSTKDEFQCIGNINLQIDVSFNDRLKIAKMNLLGY